MSESRNEPKIVTPKRFFAAISPLYVVTIASLILGVLTLKRAAEHNKLPGGNPTQEHKRFPNPNNPPVIITGGSVYTRAPIPSGSYEWTPQIASGSSGAGPEMTATTFNASSIWLDGVALPLPTQPPTPGIVGNYSVSGLANNWKITLVFRDKQAGDPGDNNAAKLYICSASDCDTNAPAPTSTNIYLKSDGNGSFYPLDTQDPPSDGDDVLRYDLNNNTSNPNWCSDPSRPNARYTKCNHLIRVEVSGVQTWSDGVTTSTSNPANGFYCPDGACSIYIGN